MNAHPTFCLYTQKYTFSLLGDYEWYYRGMRIRWVWPWSRISSTALMWYATVHHTVNVIFSNSTVLRQQSEYMHMQWVANIPSCPPTDQTVDPSTSCSWCSVHSVQDADTWWNVEHLNQISNIYTVWLEMLAGIIYLADRLTDYNLADRGTALSAWVGLGASTASNSTCIRGRWNPHWQNISAWN